MFFKFMPNVDYEFDNKEIKKVENIVIAVNPVDDIYNKQYFDTKVLSGQTPEEVSEELYRDPEYYWNILYVNKIVNPFTDWVKSSEEFEEYCMLKYGSKENLFKTKYFIDIRNKQILVGVDEDNVYKYMDENDGETPIYIQKITNYEYEQRENEKKRTIRYVPTSKLLSFNDTFETAMRLNAGEIR